MTDRSVKSRAAIRSNRGCPSHPLCGRTCHVIRDNVLGGFWEKKTKDAGAALVFNGYIRAAGAEVGGHDGNTLQLLSGTTLARTSAGFHAWPRQISMTLPSGPTSAVASV